MSKIVTFQGNELNLIGRQVKINTKASDFTVTSRDMKDVSLGDFKDKVKVVTSFPSLDTPVCDLQVKEFNKRAAGVSDDVVIVGVSKDLPFAQGRFCDANEIKNVTVVSDYKTCSFGINYGLRVKELNLLARAVLIIDKNDVIRYVQIVKEITAQPDYEDAFKALEEVIKAPAGSVDEGDLPSRCKPCEGGIAPLAKETVEKLIAQHRGWELVDDKKLCKTFQFKDFVEAKYFLDLLAVIAEEQGHHPNFTLIYNKLKVTLTTHAAGGLTDNDFIMAKIIDQLGE